MPDAHRRGTYVVVGATGAVGHVVAAVLGATGHGVRRVSRASGISLDDPGALTEAFENADGAYVMLPFDKTVPDLHAWEAEIARNLTYAIDQAQVRRVVALSGTSAHLGARAGTGAGAGILEQALDTIDVPELVCLRGCFFLNNHLDFGIAEQARTGTYATVFRSDIATPMIAASDVGHVAADLLTRDTFDQPRVRELLGAGDYTMADATRIFCTAIGKPDLAYVQVDYPDARRSLLETGVSPSFADAVIDTARSFNNGDPWAREPRSVHNTTPTTLEQFANDVVSPAYHAALARAALDGLHQH